MQRGLILACGFLLTLLFSVDHCLAQLTVQYASAYVFDPQSEWQARHGQTASQYQSTFNSLVLKVIGSSTSIRMYLMDKPYMRQPM
jgi:hypothetical protein